MEWRKMFCVFITYINYSTAKLTRKEMQWTVPGKQNWEEAKWYRNVNSNELGIDALVQHAGEIYWMIEWQVMWY